MVYRTGDHARFLGSLTPGTERTARTHAPRPEGSLLQTFGLRPESPTTASEPLCEGI